MFTDMAAIPGCLAAWCRKRGHTSLYRTEKAGRRQVTVSYGGQHTVIDQHMLSNLVDTTLEQTGAAQANRILIVPPDSTRLHGKAGLITDMLVKRCGNRIAAILPALGTHQPMSPTELDLMYPESPHALFHVHDWRHDVRELARVPREFLEDISDRRVSYDYPVQVNRLLVEGGHDLIISVGQIIPHEVAGMANHAKNLLVGTGGKEAIDKSHYLGAVCGMERIMGTIDNPVRRLFDRALAEAGQHLPPVLWILTVINRDERGNLVQRGYFAGFGRQCFEEAAALSMAVNIETLHRPIKTAVAWLDPSEYRSTWLGNKAIYRLRMAMAQGGRLIILAPGLQTFGEDPGIDMLIRKYGYRSQEAIRALVSAGTELADNLSAAAHLIHGSSKGKFQVIYATGNEMSAEAIRAVGFEWMDIKEAVSAFPPDRLAPGWNTTAGGEEIFFVPNPALGLWKAGNQS